MQDLTKRFGNGDKQTLEIEIGNQSIVDPQEQLESVTLLAQFTLKCLGILVVETVIDRNSNLPGHKLKKIHVFTAVSISAQAAKRQRAESPDRTREWHRTIGLDVMIPKNLHDLRIAGFL